MKSPRTLSKKLLPAMLALCALAPVAYSQAIPRPYKVVHIMLENSTYSDVIGKTDPRTGCPYFNWLLPISANMTKSVGNTHPTDPNYLYFFSGANQGMTGNGDARALVGNVQLTTPNLAANLIARGFSFVNYAENLPVTGDTTTFYLAAAEGDYYMDENVPAYWIGTGTNQIPPSCMQPLENLPADFNNLPDVSFWHPIEDHDMHQGYPNEKHNVGDTWTRDTIANYVQWAMKNNSLLIISWDESYTANEDPALYNHIVTLFVGPMVRPGDYSQSINHINVLRTIEDMFGTAYAGASATATPITSIWRASQTEAPIVSIDSPVNFATPEAPATIQIQASVIPNGHTISKVRFYNGSTLLGESTSAPYSYTWSGVGVTSSTIALNAKAVYDSGSVVSSAPVCLNVWPATQSLTTGLVAYLDFEGNINAAGGTTLNGVAYPSGSTPHYVTGKIGRAADFMNNGGSTPSDWSVSLGNLDSVYAGDFSYSFWVRTTSVVDTAIFGNKNWSSGGNTGFVVTTHPAGKTFNWFAASGNRHDIGVFPKISNGDWHLVTQTFSRSQNRVICYYDGKYFQETALSSNSGTLSLAAGLNTLIGSSGSGNFGSTCSVDDIGIWSRTLNPNEIAAIYANGQAGKTMLGTTPPPVTQYKLTDNLAVYLDADGEMNAMGGTAVTGTAFTGTPRYATGKFGQAFDFRNTASGTANDWAVSLGNLDSLYSGSFTLSYWMQASAATDVALIGNKNWGSGSNVGWVGALTSGKNVNWNATGGTRRDVSVSGLTDGSWHHMAVSFDRANNVVRTYKDGTLVSTNDISPAGSASFAAGYNTLIGASGPGTFGATCLMDDVAIWTRALSASEISGIAAGGAAGRALLVPAEAYGLKVYLKGDNDMTAAAGTTVTGTALTGTPHYVAGKFGQAFAFNNSGSSSAQPSDWAVNLGNLESIYSGDFSISFWEQTSSATDTALIGNKNWTSGSNVGWVIATTPNKNLNYNATGGTRTDVNFQTFSNGSWHHIVVTFNRTTNQVVTYRDGSPISTTAFSPSTAASFSTGYNTLLGSSGPGTWAGTGNLDDVAVWNRALSASEVSSIHTRGQAGEPLIP